MSDRAVQRSLKLAVSLAVAGFFVWLVVRGVDGAAIVAALRGALPGWIALAIALFLAGYACRIVRWRIMLRRDNPAIGWAPTAVAFFGSIAANNVLPFRAGDALRVFGFTRYLGIPVSTLLATLLVERLLDLLALLVVLGLALMLLPVGDDGPGTLLGASGGVLTAIGAAILALLLFPQMFDPLARFCLGLLRRISAGLGDRVAPFVDNVFVTLRHLAEGPRMLILALWSAAAWGLEGAVFWAVARAVPAMSEPVAGWLAFPVGTLSTLLPSTPGYIGTFDFFVIKSAELIGNQPAAAVAFAVLVHLVIWLPATIIGGLALVIWNLSGSPIHDRVPT